ncbi:hypothetical protein NIPOLPBK_00468 [Stenotrophomonas maltophilia]|nr:hypothetical protein NIPOLPBK_00468 [Stenotrophomonas maltophilia]
MPTTGSRPEIIPPFTSTYTKNAKPRLPASNRACVSRACTAIHRQRPTTNRYSANTVATPIQPNSSASTENAKSVVYSGRKSSVAWVPCPQPRPSQPPEPIAMRDCRMFQPVPSGSADGSRKVSTRSFWYCRSRPNQASGAATARPVAPVATQPQCNPANSSANTPLAVTSVAVPRLGCIRISTAGTPISTVVVSTVRGDGGSGCRCRYQAIISGRLSLSSSDGCR